MLGLQGKKQNYSKGRRTKGMVREWIRSIQYEADKIRILWLCTGLFLGFWVGLFSAAWLTPTKHLVEKTENINESKSGVYQISNSLKAFVAVVDSLIAIEVGDESWKSVELEINRQYFHRLPKDNRYISGEIIYLGFGNFAKEDRTIFPRDQIKMQRFAISAETPNGKAYGFCSWDGDETTASTVKVMRLHLTGHDRIAIWEEYAKKNGTTQDMLTDEAKTKAVVMYAIQQVKASP